MKRMLQTVLLLAALVPSFSLPLLAQVPVTNHVFLVVEENHSYSSIIGNSAMPYLNSLASKYALAVSYYANTHPSIGNYFMLTTGQLITNNDSYMSTVYADNIVRHLLTAGKTCKSYAESLPYVGYIGGNTGYYVRRHNPFSYFSDVVNSSVERLNLVPFTQFAADLQNGHLPNFSFIVPNIMDDAHDGTLQQADSWLKANIAPLLASSVFQKNGILVIVFDESFDTDTAYGGGHVAAVVIGPKVKPGYTSSTFFQHQSTLKMLMAALGLTSYPGAASTATGMGALFIPPAGVKVSSPTSGATVSSPVHVAASATPYWGRTITSMKVFVDGVDKYSTSASSFSTYLSLALGEHSMMVEAWDNTGTSYKSSTYNVTVN